MRAVSVALYLLAALGLAFHAGVKLERTERLTAVAPKCCCGEKCSCCRSCGTDKECKCATCRCCCCCAER